MPGLEEMIQALAGSRPVAPPPAAQMAQALAGPTMTDADPFNFMPGQQYAMMDEELRKQGKVAPQLADQFGGAAPVVFRSPPKGLPGRTTREGTPDPRYSWTPEEHQKMLDLKAAGSSASEIAKELGKTRNAVIGRVNRSGLSDPNDPRALGRRGGVVEPTEGRMPGLPKLNFMNKPFDPNEW